MDWLSTLALALAFGPNPWPLALGHSFGLAFGHRFCH